MATCLSDIEKSAQRKLAFYIAPVALAFLTFASCATQEKPADSKPMSEAAQRGKSLFEDKNKAYCRQCHERTHDKKQGLGLAHITERRPAEWIKKWVANPQAVWESKDPEVESLKKRYGFTFKPDAFMPKRELTPDEVDDLIEYLKTL